MAKWLLFVGLISAGALGIEIFAKSQQSIGYDKAKGEYAQKLNDARGVADHLTVTMEQQKNDALRERSIREKSLIADAANSRAAANELRIALANSSRSVSEGANCAGSHYVNAVTVALTECADRYSEVATIADKAELDVTALVKAWPSDSDMTP